MRRVLDEVLAVLDVLPISNQKSADATDAFVGHNMHTAHVFGGQVVGQAIAAGGSTVATDRHLHSLHAYFLAPGNWQQDIRSKVQRLRDGASFSARRITALQSRGPILQMTASWHIEEPGFSHQQQAPAVRGPEGLQTDRKRFADLARLHPEVAQFAFRFEAFDSRQVEDTPLHSRGPREPRKHTWIGAAHALPDDARVHERVLGYLSSPDFLSGLDFMSTSMMPHLTMPMARGQMQATSLDHSLWLHKPVRVDEWLLFCKERPRVQGARGFVRGDFFSQCGELVESATPECLIRPRVPHGQRAANNQ